MFAAGLTSALAAFPGDNGLIVFRRGGDELYTMNGDGSNLAIIPGVERATEPSFSADGNRIAYMRDGDIWIVNPNGSSNRNLTNTPDFQDSEPAWSPDGTEIAFSSLRDGNADVFVVRSSDGGGERRLTQATGFDGFPVWSPDGSTIAFTTTRFEEYGIHVMPADDGDPDSFIISTSVSNVWHAWFPDSSKIAWQAQNEVWVADADGSDQTQITTDARTFFGLSVSPDGEKVAFASARDGHQGGHEIYVVDIDGSNMVNITNSPATDDRQPDWGVPGDGTSGGEQQGTEEDDELNGTPQSDTVFAGAGDDTISTQGGADTVFGEEGNDVINGGAGNDKLYGEFGPQGSAPARHGRRAMLQEEPAPGNDVLQGGGGNDLGVGGPGDDKINGGPGIDRMKGGPGTDTCVFSSKRELDMSSSCEKKTRNFTRNFNPRKV
jgi:Tol biopolymer transport system component